MRAEKVQEMVTGLTRKADVLNALKENGVDYKDVSAGYGYTNIRIPQEDGSYIRIAKMRRMKGFVVGRFVPVTLQWSGVQTFEPSGRKSF